MLDADERPDGHIRVYFADNTYKTLPVKYDTDVGEVLGWLCRWLASSRGGAAGAAEPAASAAARHELFILAPGSSALRERLLLRDDKPLRIQSWSGATSFKFLLRETVPPPEGEAPAAAPPALGGQRPRASASTDSTDSEHTPLIARTPEPGTPASPSISPSTPQSRHGSGASKGSAADSPAGPEGISGRLKSGTLDRLLDDGRTWHSSTVILDEDRLWYSQVTGEASILRGRTMAHLPLSECDRVLEGEDKRILKLLTKSKTITLRARTGHERNSWLLAVVKQAALIKERDILLQAEKIISGMEHRRATQQLAKLESFHSIAGVLADREARRLFLDFARGEHDRRFCVSAGPDHISIGSGIIQAPIAIEAFVASVSDPAPLPVDEWPQGLDADGLAALLERAGVAAAAAEASKASAAVQAACGGDVRGDGERFLQFAEEVLLPRFRDQQLVQSRLCGIAAGIV